LYHGKKEKVSELVSEVRKCFENPSHTLTQAKFHDLDLKIVLLFIIL
jgi:hypothetical protein